MNFAHVPVLLTETIEGLRVRDGGIYIDGTIGGGGHAAEILSRGGKVLGIDQDTDAILHLKKKFESEINKGKLILVHGNFAQIGEIADKKEIKEVDGILLDLGVSSYQIDTSNRGFSFKDTGSLDMRMDTTTTLTAEQIVNTYTYDELYEIFAKYGEEPKARIYAGEIVAERKNGPIHTASQLAELISKESGNNTLINPATRVFQALRIVVNDEIGNLKIGLDSGFKLLRGGGRLEVISFHSLEDRAVKLFFLKLEKEGLGKIITKKPIIAGEVEVSKNRRSRSAKLRIIEKI